jgi:hypothetical protein
MNRTQSWVAMIVSMALALPVPAQTPPPPPPSAPPAAPTAAAPTFSQQELDQLVAPIALYPDDLLAQVLMASTYPLEVVQAERWVKANPGLKDKALQDALQQQPWDPSVKSLAVLPQVLTMMSEKLDWTQKLGDAFLAQQKDVLATAQALRAKAQAQGALKDSKEQKVTTDTSGGSPVIVIQPTNPEVIYVPTYNPTVVYGAWPYPSYPPYYYYPPGYVAGGALLGFTAGVIVGGAIWGNCNWRGGDVNVNVNRYNNFNRTNVSNTNWSHNAEHRGAVPYRDQNVAKQYDRGQRADAASRDAYRGRADQGAGQRGDMAANRGTSAATRDMASGRDGTSASRDMSANRGASAGTRDMGGGSAASRDMASGRGGGSSASAFDTSRGAQAQSYSNRGSSSMNSARSSGNMGGGASARAGGGGGGGGARGGGGGGRGGGGRR